MQTLPFKIGWRSESIKCRRDEKNATQPVYIRLSVDGKKRQTNIKLSRLVLGQQMKNISVWMAEKSIVASMK